MYTRVLQVALGMVQPALLVTIVGVNSMYKYQFVSTIADLLDAEEAERTLKSMRASFRWLVAILGVVWLAIGIIAFDFNDPIWRPIVWMLIGVLLVYFFAVKPYSKRRRIRRSNAPKEDLTLDFGDDCIKLIIGSIGVVTRKWEEFGDFADTKKGILFYFNDGIVNWLPNRVFANGNEKSNFIEFLNSHKPQEISRAK
jgi:hypothetical protein